MVSGLSNLTKKPIVIIASPRTGSTALGYHLGKLYPELIYYNEPNVTPDYMKDFLNRTMVQKKNDYILKLLGSAIQHYPSEIIATMFSDQVFRIKMSRKNTIEQIASYYVGYYRQKWEYYTETDLTNTNIEIELSKVRYAINRINIEENILSKISFDLELYYEDFTEFESPSKKTPIPTNYPLLIDTIKHLYRPRVS